jgi:ABC-2 type transport system ATP-binding protein
MLHQPQILFLDEPTLGLDPQTRKSIWTHLNELRSAKGVTIFMTTHYMDEAEYCDRIAIIDRGKIVALGTPEELKQMVGGDVVTITSTQPDDAAREIHKLLGVTPTRDNGSLRMEVPDGKAFVPRLVRELSAPVDTVSLRRPSLDDVFLKLTGRAIREEEVSSRDWNRAIASRWMGRRR